jgi:hypothetical protein
VERESERSQFAITGEVVGWEPDSRTLQIGDYALQVIPGISVTGVAVGTRLSVIGYTDGRGRRVVTGLSRSS